MHSPRFHLEQIFNDTEQTEVVLHSTGLDLYFVLRLNGLSFYYNASENDFKLIQWKFMSGRLHLEDSEGAYVASLVRIDDELGMVVDILRIVDKKIRSKAGGFLNIMDSYTSSSIESYIEERDLLDERQAESASELLKRQCKQYSAPFIFVALLLYLVFFF